MNAKVDTSNHDGLPLQAMSEGAPLDTNIYRKQYEFAESHVKSLLHK
jgi:hypothetical protein